MVFATKHRCTQRFRSLLFVRGKYLRRSGAESASTGVLGQYISKWRCSRRAATHFQWIPGGGSGWLGDKYSWAGEDDWTQAHHAAHHGMECLRSAPVRVELDGTGWIRRNPRVSLVEP